MTIRTFGIAAAIAAILAAGYGVSLILRQWEPAPVAGYEVRRNRITGKVQVKAGSGQWTAFETDPYAPPLTPDQLKQLAIKNIAWGPGGIVCARITNRSSQPIKGRLGFSIIIRDAFDNKWTKDRTLRQTVDLPALAETPFVLNTGMETPDAAKRKTTIVPVPTTYSGTEDQ